MASRTESDIRRIEKGLVDGVSQAIGEMAFAVYSAVVIATPVDTGRARGNWQPSIGQPENRATEVRDKGGSVGVSKARSLFANYKVGPNIFISNNLPYIQRLNEGHSKQAPSGFVEKAINAGVESLNRQGDLFS